MDDVRLTLVDLDKVVEPRMGGLESSFRGDMPHQAELGINVGLFLVGGESVPFYYH